MAEHTVPRLVTIILQHVLLTQSCSREQRDPQACEQKDTGERMSKIQQQAAENMV